VPPPKKKKKKEKKENMRQQSGVRLPGFNSWLLHFLAVNLKQTPKVLFAWCKMIIACTS
jgi:hypothetical protein